MQRNRTPDILIFCLITFMLAFFLSMRVFNDGVPGWKSIITSDGRGYYAYLPALLIDHDPTFARVAEKEARLLAYPHYKPGYLVHSGKQKVNKYFVGEALLLFPFFLTGTLCSWFAGTDINGYSFFFQVFTGIGTLFYLFLGLIFLKRVLESMQIRAMVVSLTLAAVLLGTNLFYYSLWQPTMSHVFSFFAINGFMYYTTRAIREWSIKTASLMGFFLGVICLVRPTNIVAVLLVPFLSGEPKSFSRFIGCAVAKKTSLILFGVIFIAVLAVQGLVWYIQTGKLIIWSYHGEGFNFGSPEIVNVLFSYRKGLFTYTPLILISLLGLVPLLLRRWLQLASMCGFLILGTYVIASWWNWYYGDGFGLRAFIDYYGVSAILLATAINFTRSKAILAGWTILLTLLVAFNFLQTWQYTHRVIQPNSMNSLKYHHIFMRTDSAVINCLGGNEELPDYIIEPGSPARAYFNNFEHDQASWINNCIVKTPSAYSDSCVGYLDSTHQFSPGIAARASLFGQLPSSYFIRGEVMIRDSIPGASNDILVVLSMDSISPGENWWQGFRLNDVPTKNAGLWSKRQFSLMTPVISNPGGILKVYLWNTGKKTLLMDDFRVVVFGRKQADVRTGGRLN